MTDTVTITLTPMEVHFLLNCLTHVSYPSGAIEVMKKVEALQTKIMIQTDPEFADVRDVAMTAMFKDMSMLSAMADNKVDFERDKSIIRDAFLSGAKAVMKRIYDRGSGVDVLNRIEVELKECESYMRNVR